MKRWARPLLCIGVAVAFHGCGMDRTFTPTPGTPPSAPPDAASIARGAYLVDAANCAGCHTDKKHGGAPFAGGGAVPTPFGDYYSRNITPDREHGIGAWSDANFLEALREGISPSGAPYFSAFPFTSFTNMTDRDILDIKAYLGTLPPSAQENRAHDVGFPYDMRAGAGFWRALYFSPGPLKPDPAHDAAWNRGNYLVNAVAHCAECHTPRDWLGGLENEKRFSGGRLAGPDVKKVPNITQDRATGIGDWKPSDIEYLLKTGIKADGDSVERPMSEVADATAKLTDADRAAIAEYLKSLPALPSAYPPAPAKP